MNLKLHHLDEKRIAIWNEDTNAVFWFDIEDTEIVNVDESFAHEFGVEKHFTKLLACNLYLSEIEDESPYDKFSLSDVKKFAYDYINELDVETIEELWSI